MDYLAFLLDRGIDWTSLTLPECEAAIAAKWPDASDLSRDLLLFAVRKAKG